MDGVVHTLNPSFAEDPIYHDVQESAPVPDDAPIIDMARLNLADPFENTLWQMAQLYRTKKHDYTPEGESPWWAFDESEGQEGMYFNAAPLYEIGKKRNRLKSTRSRGYVLNEPVADSYRDLANFGVIAYARFLFPMGIVE